MSELKCCKRCTSFTTCDHKGECCIECEYFDPVDMICMAPPEVKAAAKIERIDVEDEEEVDPATFLFDDDDDDDDDLSDLPPERDDDEDEDNFNPADDDDW